MSMNKPLSGSLRPSLSKLSISRVYSSEPIYDNLFKLHKIPVNIALMDLKFKLAVDQLKQLITKQN